MMLSQRSRIYIGLVYASLILFLLLFAPFRQGTNTDVNLIPFASFVDMLSPYFVHEELPTWHYTGHTAYNIFGNLLMFLPIPILFGWRHQLVTMLLISIGVPSTIEMLQYLLEVGSANVDDILLNTIGFLLGYRWVKPTESH